MNVRHVGRITELEVDRIVALVDGGLTFHAVAKRLGVAHSTVSIRYLKRKKMLGQEPSPSVKYLCRPRTVGPTLFSILLRQMRGSASLRQAAGLFGCDKSHISKLENGDIAPSYRLLLRLAEVFNAPLAELEAAATTPALSDWSPSRRRKAKRYARQLGRGLPEVNVDWRPKRRIAKRPKRSVVKGIELVLGTNADWPDRHVILELLPDFPLKGACRRRRRRFISALAI